MTAKHLERELKKLGNPLKAAGVARFFKTGKGEYGEGDRFLGISVPAVRAFAKTHQEASLAECVALLSSPFHEVRLLALILLIIKYVHGSQKEQQEIYRQYLKHTRFINNWDLVDVSAPQIIGRHLYSRSRMPLYKLAKSKNLWERRIAIVSTLFFIVKGESGDALAITEMLLKDEHDLIHKACGWMLREVGKRCEAGTLESFLDQHALTMPRTMLRYAIERFPEKKRQSYLRKV